MSDNRVQRQVRLPMSKAVEIAWKSIRLRISRSLLVTSGIVLAIAFLMAIQVNEAIIDGMRRWIISQATAPRTLQLREESRQISAKLADLRPTLRDTAAAAPAGESRVKLEEAIGSDMADLTNEGIALPTSPDSIEHALAANPHFKQQLLDWLAAERAAKRIQDELTRPAQLAERLSDQGVPTEPEAIADAKIKNRWLLGLALLVAFVGILNAMLMSVTERFREIGTMKCLGALDGFIIKLFLIESLFQGVVGTAIGLTIGLLASVAINWLTYGNLAFAAFPWNTIAQACGISAAVGLLLTVAGAIYPAWQAARMPPIEAMRAEV